MKPTRYSVLTYNYNLGKYTPQQGVPSIVQGFSGLRQAIRLLRQDGYTAHRCGADRQSDHDVLIQRER